MVRKDCIGNDINVLLSYIVSNELVVILLAFSYLGEIGIVLALPRIMKKPFLIIEAANYQESPDRIDGANLGIVMAENHFAAKARFLEVFPSYEENEIKVSYCQLIE